MKKLLVYILLFNLCSCHDDHPPGLVTDPKQAILGRWEVIENSFGPISYPGSYTEYRQDSILFDYVNTNDFTYSKYWMNDSILFTKSTYYIYEGPGYEDTLIVVLPYKYEFLSYNKLRLDLQYPAMVTTFIFKRIK